MTTRLMGLRSTRRRLPVRLFLCAILLLPTSCVAAASRKVITWDELHGEKRVNFNGTYVSGLRWLDAHSYLERRDGILQRVDARTGEARPAYDHAALERALREELKLDEGPAQRLARRPAILSTDYSLAIIEHEKRLYAYRFAEGALRALTAEEEGRSELTLSPTNDRLAWVRGNNLFAFDLDTQQTTQLTTDGSDTLLNGVMDWVYQEELYGRGNWRAYWWSKDGAYLAFLQLDEAEVPTYPLVDFTTTRPAINPLRYPKAGDPNPKVRLGVAAASGGIARWVDLSKYEGVDILIVQVSWSLDGHVIFGVQDREARWLELCDAAPEDAAGRPAVPSTAEGPAATQTLPIRVLLREDSPAWVDVEGPPRWLADGSFLWLSTRTGYKHLYHHERDGTLRRAVTSGAWAVRDFQGVDEAAGLVYFTGSYDSVLQTHAYRVPLAGGGIERLTPVDFHHNVSFNETCTYFIDQFSNARTPPRVYLRDHNGARVRVLSANEVPALTEYRLSLPVFVRVPTPRGVELNGRLIRPLNPRAGEKHPVYSFVYGAPHAPSVRDAWEGNFAFKQWLASQGFLVWECDPQSAGGESAAAAWTAYQRLGPAELEDLEAAARWLIEHEDADPNRIAIFGHSYGGFVAAYALTHGSVFTHGIAVAPVTDWRNYDSIYTERYLRTPQNNPQGYDAGSAVVGAAGLHGRLLLVHGALDDNVHVTNTLQLVEAFGKAGKRSFEVMIYPRDNHGAGTYYAQRQMLGLEFLSQMTNAR